MLSPGAALASVNFRYYRTQGQGWHVGIGFSTLVVGRAAKSESAIKAMIVSFFMMFYCPSLLQLDSNVGTRVSVPRRP
jgi:hypothetical protein